MPLWLLALLLIGSPIVVSILGLWLVRRNVSPQSLREHHDVAGFILAIVGVIYAVLLAFVVIAVWEEFEEAKVVAEKEANALMDVYRMAPGFSAALKNQVRADVKVYAQSVVQDEWPTMSNGQNSDKTARALDRLWRAFIQATPRMAREASLYDQSIARLTDVSDNRRLRLLASKNGLPGPLWGVLIFGGIATMLFTYFFGLEKFSNQASMTALLAGTIGLVIFVISALNYPFSGELRIEPEAMQSVLERFDTLEEHEKLPG